MAPLIELIKCNKCAKHVIVFCTFAKNDNHIVEYADEMSVFKIRKFKQFLYCTVHLVSEQTSRI